MKNQNRMRAAVAVALVGVALTGCSRTDGSPTARGSFEASTSPQTQAPTSVVVEPTATVPTVTEADTGPPIATTTEADTEPPVDVTSVPPTESERPGSGHGLCFDLNTKLSQDAIASVGTDSNGGAWRIGGASNNPLSEGCGLDFLLLNGSGFNDATYTSRVLLFGNGKYLGTVEPHEFSYTSIARHTLNSVTVRYRWLRADDAFCCPQGGPTEVTMTLSGGRLIRTGEFPPEP